MVLDLTKVIKNNDWADRKERCDCCGNELTSEDFKECDGMPDTCRTCYDDLFNEGDSFDESDDDYL